MHASTSVVFALSAHGLDLRQIFKYKCTHLNFTVYGHKQTSIDIYTNVCNAVSLVWGSLRLGPIMLLLEACIHPLSVFSIIHVPPDLAVAVFILPR